MENKYRYILIALILVGSILFIPYKADCYMIVEKDSLVFEINETGEFQQVGSMKIDSICENHENLFSYLIKKFFSRNHLISKIEFAELYNNGEGIILDLNEENSLSDGLVSYIDGDGTTFGTTLLNLNEKGTGK